MPDRRSFDFVWRKIAPNSAQDDTSIFFSKFFQRNFSAIFSNEIF